MRVKVLEVKKSQHPFVAFKDFSDTTPMYLVVKQGWLLAKLADLGWIDKWVLVDYFYVERTAIAYADGLITKPTKESKVIWEKNNES